MNKSKIEWTDYTINPVKGLCPMTCPYCYARRMYKRYHWDETIRFTNSLFNELPHIKRPSRIFVGSTMELFGSWIESDWMRLTFEAVKLYPQHTFIFLTKQPQNLIKWSPFPDNCWVGVSATNEMMAAAGSAWLGKIKAPIKFLSLEPLLSWDSENAFNSIIRWHPENIQWLIIGQQTPANKATRPQTAWISEIIQAADKVQIPVFVKDNILKDKVLGLNSTEMRQEFPVTAR